MHLPAVGRQYLSSSDMNMLHRVLSGICLARATSIQGTEAGRIARQLVRRFQKGVILTFNFTTEPLSASAMRTGSNRARSQHIDVERWENEGGSPTSLTTDREADEERP